MKRVIIKQPARKMSCATRVRARNSLTAPSKLGKVGMFDFTFALVKDAKHPGQVSKVVQEKCIKADSYDEAVMYARCHTPAGHQGLIDGQSVICR